VLFIGKLTSTKIISDISGVGSFCKEYKQKVKKWASRPEVKEIMSENSKKLWLDQNYKDYRLIFIDDGFRRQFLECYESGGKYKKSLHQLLKDAYQTGKITLEDRNNVNVFTNDKKDKLGSRKMFDDIHKKIGTVRMYKNGDNESARRFEQFDKAFKSYKASSQTGKPGEYNIDFAKDTYHHNGFVHETNIAYITFRFD
jgi:hypothetical protein